jgi:hypothetical protein
MNTIITQTSDAATERTRLIAMGDRAAALDFCNRIQHRANVRCEQIGPSDYYRVTIRHPDGSEQHYGDMSVSHRQMFRLFDRAEDCVAILAPSARMPLPTAGV